MKDELEFMGMIADLILRKGIAKDAPTELKIIHYGLKLSNIQNGICRGLEVNAFTGEQLDAINGAMKMAINILESVIDA